MEENLSVINEIIDLGKQIFGVQDVSVTLNKVGQKLVDLVGAKYIAFFSVESSEHLNLLFTYGDVKDELVGIQLLSWAEELALRSVEQSRWIYESAGSTLDMAEKEMVKNGFAIPLRTVENIVGVVVLLCDGCFEISELSLLVEGICVPLLGELVNVRLYRQMENTFLSTIRALSSAIDAKHPYTRGHSERVTTYSVAIAKELGLSEEDIKYLRISALLHDVGKIGISDAVLDKHGKLDDAEFDQIRQHPTIGAKIVSQIVNSDRFISGILDHHERFDGRGYPNGKKGEEISLYGRIIAVADAFDAMTSTRSYRKAIPFQLAVEEIVYNSSYQFDPKMVKAFVQAYEREKEIWQRESIIYSAR